jgi:2,3-bisphosphoglycerate-independent phosphoglycerate mutase
LLQPLVLVILDGYGLSPTLDGNGIFNAQTPNFDQLLSYFPHAALHASGEEVGLAWGEMGNSEVGHLNLGTGRIIAQDIVRIDKTIADQTFANNPALKDAFENVRKNQSNLHLLGLVSAGGVHSHINHLFALLEMAAKLQVKNVFIHMITDGRDTPEKVALEDLKKLEAKMAELGLGKIASVGGRYFAMDRDKHWDRVSKAYEVMFSESAPKAKSAAEAISASYQNNKNDEFIEPVAIDGTPRIVDKDSIIFFNFRSDRAKQITDAIINPNFDGFKRSVVLKDYLFVSFTSYGHEPSASVKVAFFADSVTNQLAKILESSNLKQVHIAETEKYPHVTYFFNGGMEKPFVGEDRVLVASPKVATYDLKPEMSAAEIAQKFISSFTPRPAFSVINLANADMVGHTGNFEAVKIAVAAADAALGKISNAALSAGANLIVTADHGNAEQMINPETGEIDKEHTTNPVPVILALSEKKAAKPIEVNLDYKVQLASTPPAGVLADVTTTCVDCLTLSLPAEMTGQSLKNILQ